MKQLLNIAKIVAKKNINNTYMQIDLVLNKSIPIEPGQFIMVQLDKYSIRQPYTCIAIENQILTIIVHKNLGTMNLINMPINQNLNIIAPLGKPIKLLKNKKILICATDHGVVFAYNLAKKLLELNNEISVIVWFKKIENIYLSEEFQKLEVFKFITLCEEKKDLNLEDYLNNTNLQKFDHVYLGCNPFLTKILDKKFLELNISGYILHHQSMGCGIGICSSCTIIKNNGTTQKSCLNPIFAIGEINHG